MSLAVFSHGFFPSKRMQLVAYLTSACRLFCRLVDVGRFMENEQNKGGSKMSYSVHFTRFYRVTLC